MEIIQINIIENIQMDLSQEYILFTNIIKRDFRQFLNIYLFIYLIINLLTKQI